MARRLGDVVDSRMDVEGEQHQVRDLVGEEFTITKVQEWEGNNGPYMAVAIEIDGKPGFFFTSHTAIFRKLQAAADIIAREPLAATIKQVEAKNPQGFYYDIA